MNGIEEFDFITSVCAVEVGKDRQRLSGRRNRSSIKSIHASRTAHVNQLFESLSGGISHVRSSLRR
jgi:hypothetical protein